MRYQVTKTVSHEQGWSSAFRQWRAESHCRFIHGYALAVEFVFEADTLDSRNWVIDFGDFKPLRAHLADLFDHKTIIAIDDPLLSYFDELAAVGAIDLVVTQAVGCEAFATLIAKETQTWLSTTQYANRVRLVSIEVREHGSNAAKVVLDGQA